RAFENKEELAQVVNNLLNEGGLTINWSKRFKNKGDLVSVM
nr:IS630 family transposase [Xenococcaceae cyanobacterium MO_167.B27]